MCGPLPPSSVALSPSVVSALVSGKLVPVNVVLEVALQCTRIPSRGSRNTPSHSCYRNQLKPDGPLSLYVVCGLHKIFILIAAPLIKNVQKVWFALQATQLLPVVSSPIGYEGDYPAAAIKWDTDCNTMSHTKCHKSLSTWPAFSNPHLTTPIPENHIPYY